MLDEFEALDSRIKVITRQTNGHISAATNSALDLASGEFVALLDHDDCLPEHALYEVAVELNAHPDADVIYSDSDFIDDAGQRRLPYFKPDWDPDLMLGHNMVSHLGVYRRSLIEDIGRLRVDFEGSQDYDLMLRAAAATTPSRIRHVPAVLYHWRRRGGNRRSPRRRSNVASMPPGARYASIWSTRASVPGSSRPQAQRRSTALSIRCPARGHSSRSSS